MAAYKIKHNCHFPGCSELTRDRLCYKHLHFNKVEKQNSNKDYDLKRGSAYKRGYDRNWQRLRIMYLNQNPLCSTPGCNQPATDVHHVIPLRSGGDNSFDNLKALCHSCHSKETAKEKRAEGV